MGVIKFKSVSAKSIREGFLGYWDISPQNDSEGECSDIQCLNYDRGRIVRGTVPLFTGSGNPESLSGPGFEQARPCIDCPKETDVYCVFFSISVFS